MTISSELFRTAGILLLVVFVVYLSFLFDYRHVVRLRWHFERNRWIVSRVDRRIFSVFGRDVIWTRTRPATLARGRMHYR